MNGELKAVQKNDMAWPIFGLNLTSAGRDQEKGTWSYPGTANIYRHQT